MLISEITIYYSSELLEVKIDNIAITLDSNSYFEFYTTFIPNSPITLDITYNTDIENAYGDISVEKFNKQIILYLPILYSKSITFRIDPYNE